MPQKKKKSLLKSNSWFIQSKAMNKVYEYTEHYTFILKVLKMNYFWSSKPNSVERFFLKPMWEYVITLCFSKRAVRREWNVFFSNPFEKNRKQWHWSVVVNIVSIAFLVKHYDLFNLHFCWKYGRLYTKTKNVSQNIPANNLQDDWSYFYTT